jgi:hypothetical protein
MANWTPTDEGMPPEGVIVEAIDPAGGHLRLKWQDRLWLFADGSNYIFFTPTYWRSVGTTSQWQISPGGWESQTGPDGRSSDLELEFTN